MSEDKTLTASNDAGTAGSSAGGGSAGTRKKTTARAASSSRSGRGQGASSGSTFGKAALESQARAQNPSLGDDPFQSGQRIWPD